MKAARSKISGGFTMIEIMVVIAIIGLIMAMGMPSIIDAFKREGMRKAIWQIDEICKKARSEAVLHNQITWVIFYPQQGNAHYQYMGVPLFGDSSLETGTPAPAATTKPSTQWTVSTSDKFPDGVEIALFDINRLDFAESGYGKVRFFPDGTCDEMIMVLIYKDQRRKLTLQYSTAMLEVTDKIE